MFLLDKLNVELVINNFTRGDVGVVTFFIPTSPSTGTLLDYYSHHALHHERFAPVQTHSLMESRCLLQTHRIFDEAPVGPRFLEILH